MPAALADRILERFADPAGGFFDTADDHERLITRPKDAAGQRRAVRWGDGYDGAPAAGGVDRRGALSGGGGTGARTVAPYLARYPTGFAQWLMAASFAASIVDEVAIVGDPADIATRELLAPVWATWRPNQVLAAAPERRTSPTSAVPLLHDRIAIDGRPTAYVCRDFACRLPVTDPAALAEQLESEPVIG